MRASFVARVILLFHHCSSNLSTARAKMISMIMKTKSGLYYGKCTGREAVGGGSPALVDSVVTKQ